MSQVIELHQPDETFRYTYSAGHPPISRVRPGDTLAFHTVNAFHNRITRNRQLVSQVHGNDGANPLTGPVCVDGAEPGDTLSVQILDIQPTRDFAVTALLPGFGALVPGEATPMISPPLPEQTRILPIEGDQIRFSDQIRLPLRMFMGTIGVAPELEARGALTPGRWGGNMDCPDVCAGNTVQFPVFHPGALLFAGDGHACQGDGEITGVAGEIPTRCVVKVELLKNHPIDWPRIISPTHLMTVGAARPLGDALRIAAMALIGMLEREYGMDRIDAYTLLGQAVEFRVANMVDPNFTVAAKIARSLIEPRR